MKAQTLILIPIYHSIFKHISNFTLTVFIEYSGGLIYAKSFSSLGVQYVAGSVQGVFLIRINIMIGFDPLLTPTLGHAPGPDRR